MSNITAFRPCIKSISVFGFVLGINLFVISYSFAVPTQDPPIPCDTSSTVTGKIYNVLGSRINVRRGPGTSYEKVINQDASSVLDTIEYVELESNFIVHEDCTRKGWSRIKVVEPNWLVETYIGWVASKFLDKGPKEEENKGAVKEQKSKGAIKGQKVKGDKYSNKIGSSVLSPYTKKSFPKTVKKYGPRLKEVERFRRKAAEMALDSGKCDYVVMSEISDYGSLDDLLFWVDCKNKQRFYYDEFALKKGN